MDVQNGTDQLGIVENPLAATDNLENHFAKHPSRTANHAMPLSQNMQNAPVPAGHSQMKFQSINANMRTSNLPQSTQDTAIFLSNQSPRSHNAFDTAGSLNMNNNEQASNLQSNKVRFQHEDRGSREHSPSQPDGMVSQIHNLKSVNSNILRSNDSSRHLAQQASAQDIRQQYLSKDFKIFASQYGIPILGKDVFSGLMPITQVNDNLSHSS